MKKSALLFVVIISSMISCTPYQERTTEPKEYAQVEYPFATKKVKLSHHGIELAYADEGAGTTTIVFIHGLGSYMPAWKKNIEQLRTRYRCIAVDLPGYGKSSKGNYPFSLKFYASAVAELLETLGIKRAVWCGHSMGGQIALTAALYMPERVQQLMLVDPAGFESFTEGEKEWFRTIATSDLTRLTTTQQIRANLATNFYNLPHDAEFMITDRIALRGAKDFEGYCYAVAQSIKAMVNEPVIDYLHTIQQPTLIVFGANDALIPNAYLHGGTTQSIAEIGAQKIKNSTLVLIPECGHFAQFEKSEEFNKAVIEFLH